MCPNPSHPPRASQRELLADVRATATPPLKADLVPQARANRLRDVAADAMRSTSGNARAAAIDMDIHEGHLSRLLKDGTIRLEQLEALGPAFAAKFGAELVEQFGALTSPKDHARRALRAARQQLDQLEQFIEGAA